MDKNNETIVHRLGGVHKVVGVIDKTGLKDPDAILDTGIKIVDVVPEAIEWWENIGRDMMLAHRHSDECGGKGISSDPNNENFLPSGILGGKPWDELIQHERLFIVKQYHHQKYRLPMKEAKSGTSGIII